MMLLWLLVLVGVCYWLYYQLVAKHRKYPPGPTPLPLLGNFIDLLRADDSKAGELFLNWAKQYGNVYTIYILNSPAVILTDPEMQKQCMKMDEMCGRMETALLDIAYGGYYGILNTEGDLWWEQRKFSMHILGDLGVGKAIMEEHIYCESEHLIQHIKDESVMNENGVIQAMKPNEAIQLCVINVISAICFGVTFAKGDQTLTDLRQLLRKQMELVLSPKGALLSGFSFVRHIPLFGHFGADVLKDSATGFQKLTAKYMDAAELNIDESSEVSSLTEAFVKEMKKRRRAGDLGNFTLHQLSCSIIDIFVAGFEQTVVTLRFAVLRLVHEQDVQEEIHKDIMHTTAQGTRNITLADRPQLVRLNAFILEVQRISNVTPMALPHKTLRDVRVGDYVIPAKTIVMYPTIAVHQNPRIFPDPYKFDITRFMGPDREKNAQFVRPFGIGKRQCLGENLAGAELFLILAHLIQTFHIRPADPENPPTLNFDKKRPYCPVDYECIFEPRN